MSFAGADLKERAKMHASEVSSFVSKARSTINEMGKYNSHWNIPDSQSVMNGSTK